MNCRYQYIYALLFISMLVGCRPSRSVSDGYLDYLYEHMDYSDSLIMTDGFWKACVDESIAARANVSWSVDEEDFLQYVLPVRVGREHLDAFRLAYADSLLAEVSSLDAQSAVHRINEWLLERVQYSDSLFSDGPVGIMSAGKADCSSMAELAATAFRTVGLPARVAYCKWKKGGGHAWVDVKVDGQWHIFGPSEYMVVFGESWEKYSIHLAKEIWRYDLDGNRFDAMQDYPDLPNLDFSQEVKDFHHKRTLELQALYHSRRASMPDNSFMTSFSDSFLYENTLSPVEIRKDVISKLKGNVLSKNNLHEWVLANIHIEYDPASQSSHIPPEVAWSRRSCNIRSLKMFEYYLLDCLNLLK